MREKPLLLLIAPAYWVGELADPLAQAGIAYRVHGRDSYDPTDIDYALSFRPPLGLLKTLPKLKACFSLGAGVDGFFADLDYPKHIPLARFVDESLATEMAQYVVLQVLMHHRDQRALDRAQTRREWAQTLLARRTADTRIGILGLGEMGLLSAELLHRLGFAVSGWSRSTKHLTGVRSFAGSDALKPFLAECDVLVCLLPLTKDTTGILNAQTFSMLPQGAYVINAARGGHLIEKDLIAAIDRGHLSGAALDVFETEPLPASSPLWHHPKIVVTPHLAAISDPAATVRCVLEGIAHSERGEPIPNLVDWERGY